MTTQQKKDIWEFLDESSGRNIVGDIADMYHWSTNYDPGAGPFTLFLDLIGWSDENAGTSLYTGSQLGYVEMDMLGRCLVIYSDNPRSVDEWLEELMNLELGE